MALFFFMYSKLIRLSLVVLLPMFLIRCGDQPRRINELKISYAGYQLNTEYGNCRVLADAVDPLTGLRKTDLEPVRILSYTHPRLSPYFKEAPFLMCFASLSLIDEKRVLLNMSFSLAARNVDAAYHGLAEDSMLRVELINGESLFLSNLIEDTGRIDPGGRKVYTAIFPLTRSQIKKLRKYEISKLGVIWKGGFETYDVFEIDVLKRQLACLKTL
jgi:hypothetical protein